MKTCTKCGVEKEESDFRKGRRQCKQCEKVRDKNYRIKNPGKYKLQQREYYAKNADKINSARKESYAKNIDKRRSQQREYYAKNADKINSASLKYYTKNRDKLKARNSEWHTKNRNKSRENSRKCLNKQIENASDKYVKRLLKRQYGLTYETLNENPEFIESKRIELKINRLLKKRRKNNDTEND